MASIRGSVVQAVRLELPQTDSRLRPRRRLRLAATATHPPTSTPLPEQPARRARAAGRDHSRVTIPAPRTRSLSSTEQCDGLTWMWSHAYYLSRSAGPAAEENY
ncbi:hypothetical protein SORBI_3008G162400 [Sorghum bicolor]|uniref:Uncharacterized protein n=1 Tax=Sorghum bicolor TaxID=4558 RepID=A0A1B6PE34_SORBI|nr:hypothetical protein SORBI_3008G162400 [Sorghum bicolor]